MPPLTGRAAVGRFSLAALLLTACGLTTGEISAHFDEVYGAKVFKDTVWSTAVVRGRAHRTAAMSCWSCCPTEEVVPDLVELEVAVPRLSPALR
jgi:hypothetical protein